MTRDSQPLKVTTAATNPQLGKTNYGTYPWETTTEVQLSNSAKFWMQATKLLKLGHLGYGLAQRVERRPANRDIQQLNRLHHGGWDAPNENSFVYPLVNE